jgi:hypothetical protein
MIKTNPRAFGEVEQRLLPSPRRSLPPKSAALEFISGHWLGPSCCSDPTHTSFKRAPRRWRQDWSRSDTRIPASAACTALSPCYLSPPHACWRCLLLRNYRHPPGRRRAHSVPPSLPHRKNEGTRSIAVRARHSVTGDICPWGATADPKRGDVRLLPSTGSTRGGDGGSHLADSLAG